MKRKRGDQVAHELPTSMKKRMKERMETKEDPSMGKMVQMMAEMRTMD